MKLSSPSKPSVVADGIVGSLPFQWEEQRGIVQTCLHGVPSGQKVPEGQGHLWVLTYEVVEEEDPFASLVDLPDALDVACDDDVQLADLAPEGLDRHGILCHLLHQARGFRRRCLNKHNDVIAWKMNRVAVVLDVATGWRH